MRKDDLERLESIGPEGVLLEIAQGKHGQQTSKAREEVEAWLRSKQVSAQSLDSARHDARSSEAIRIAKRDNLIAWIAAAIAATSIIKDIIVEILMAYP